MDISIIIPSLNEEDIIASTLLEVATYIDNNPWLGTCEVIVVAAGKDKTAEIAQSLSNKFAHLHIIQPPRQVGKGRDVQAGIEHASGAIQLFMDADLSTPLSHIKQLVSLLREDTTDIVIGQRKVAHIHASFIRRMLSQVGPFLSKVVLGLPWRDTQCGFKGFKAEAAKTLFDNLATTGWGFDLDILLQAKEEKLLVKTIAINDWHETRSEGLKGQSTMKVAIQTLYELLSIRFIHWGRKCTRHVSGLILISSIIAGIIAAYKNISESIWFDEAFTSAIIKRPFTQLIQGTAHDVHPPLYYLILKVWAGLFGSSIVTLRVFSVVCGVAALYIGLRLIKRLFGARTALYAIPFAVFAPFLLRYDIEARMYALASLIGIAATYVLVIAMERYEAKKTGAKKYWITYAILVALGLYTLYYTALIWIAHFIWCTLLFKRHNQKARSVFKEPWLLAMLFGAALFLPWIPAFMGQLSHVQSGFWIGKPTLDTVISVLTTALGYMVTWQLSTWESLIILLASIAGFYFVIKAWKMSKASSRRYLLLLMLYTCIPVAVLFTASLPPLQPVFVERYVSQTIISGYLLLGVCIAIVHKARLSFGNLITSLFILCVLIQGTVTLQRVGNYNFETVDRPSAKQVMSYLYTQNATTGTVLSQSPELYLELHYYAPTAPWLRPDLAYNIDLALGPTKQPPTQLTTHTIWYVYGGSQLGGDDVPGKPYKLIKSFSIPNGYTVATFVHS